MSTLRSFVILFFATALGANLHGQDSNSVRVIPPEAICQIRVQVASSAGAVVFDSGWRDGSVFDLPTDVSQRIASGSYRTVVMVKDVDGRVTERDLGSQGTGPRLAFVAHDGTNGLVVSTGGDLAFRLGDFAGGKDAERMRLTADGRVGIGIDRPQATLDVKGSIRATDGIVFSDGTTLTSEGGHIKVSQSRDSAPPQPVAPPIPAAPSAILKPRPNTLPGPQFQITDTGIQIGTTNPLFKLDVAGVINTETAYQISGITMLFGNTNSSNNTYAGQHAGQNNFFGTDNAFFGSLAGWATGGSSNSFFGSYAGEVVANVADNSFFGSHAGVQTSIGHGNSFFGSNAAHSNSSGSNNSFFGTTAAAALTLESENSGLGYLADVSAGVTNSTAIGAHAKTAQSNTVILGSINLINSATATASTGIATQTPNQYLGVGGGITVDENNTNNGTLLLNSAIAFGTSGPMGLSGEAIASPRTGAANVYGLDFYTAYAKRLSITNAGNVGVWTSAPGATFEVAATKTTLADAWTIRSSARFKENIQPIASALQKTEQLRGVSFDYKQTGKHSIGFIAEEVAEVLPEAVQRDGNGEIVGLDYNRITPLLLEALKAQQKVIESLEQRVRKLEAAAAH
jgi:endosialidase-like protein